MSVGVLHRRLTAGMALAALLAYAAGAGWTPDVLAGALALVVAMVRLPPPSWGPSVERATRIVIVALCAWMVYVAFVLVGDFMPAVMAMLLVLLGGEALRPLDSKNDGRLYLLAFALMIAATAYYPGLAFAAAFVGFVVLSTLAMMVGSLRRQAERFGVPGVRVPRRTLIGAASLSAVTLLVSVSFFVIFPRLPRQWNVQGRGGSGDVMTGFGDGVTLGEHGGRLTPNPEVAFRVEFPDGNPAYPEMTYWRGRSFDRFDGVRWSRTRGVPGQAYAGGYARRWGGPIRRARIFGGPAGADVLFGEHPILSVQPRSAIRVYQDPTGDVAYTGSDSPVYTVTSGRALPPERLLRNSPETNSPLVSSYLQLPPLSPAVRALADSLTRGATGRLEKARAVQRYLSTAFEYSLDLPDTRRDATVEGFLFRRRAGHCEYFSTAMVVLLRSVGIPARNVTGFLGGEWNQFGNYLAVTGNDAHSWVEVWFPRLGWVPFDPTPPSRGTLVETETGTGWSWPARFWFDGLEHRWYKWVVDYNLEKQLDLFRGVGDLFDRNNGAAPWSRDGQSGSPGVPPLVAVVVGLLMAGAAVAWVRRGRRGPRSAETRAYLALRRAYERARLGGSGGPMDFAERLERDRAPGAAHAAELVRLYVRARFGGEDIGDVGRQRIGDALREARAALRAGARSRRDDREPPPGGDPGGASTGRGEAGRRRGREPAGV